MKNRGGLRGGIVLVLLILLFLLGDYVRNLRQEMEGQRPPSQVEIAFADRLSTIQVEGGGTVTALLPDDLEGSRHQRFILQITPDHTLLIVHNIDLAPRLESLGRGDWVDFFGEYQWNARGGLVHWTHHDPRGQHPDGWLRHRGRLYQ